MPNDPLRAVMVGLCLPLLQVASVLGADLPRADEATDYLAPRLMADTRPRWTPDRRDGSAAFAGFLVWPAVTVGALIDSNPLHAHGAHRTAGGLRLAPHFVAERDSGVHATTLYGAADIHLLPGAARVDTLNGRVGLLHDWAIGRTAMARFQLEASRRTNPFETAALLPGLQRRALLDESDGVASASIQDTFGRFFVVLGGTALRSHLDVAGGGTGGALSDETALTAKVRAGYQLTGSIYTFAEPAANWRSLDVGDQHAHGTRVVVGLGTSGGGPSQAEIFVGRQEQTYAGRIGHLSGVVAGGRLAWSPTPAWTAVAQVDESLGQAAVATAVDAIGTPTRERTVAGKLVFAPSPLWSAELAGGGVWIDYVGTVRRDQLTFAAAKLDYAVSRSFDLTCEVRSAALASTVHLAAYHRTTATLGATYHY